MQDNTVCQPVDNTGEEPVASAYTEESVAVPSESGRSSPVLSEAETQRKRTVEEMDEVGQTPLNRSTRLGGVSKTPLQSSSESEGTPACKRGRKSAFEKFMSVREAAQAEKAVLRQERDASKGNSMNSLMELYMMMQRDRMEEERQREARDAE